jgi:hypothetical protein
MRLGFEKKVLDLLEGSIDIHIHLSQDTQCHGIGPACKRKWYASNFG